MKKKTWIILNFFIILLFTTFQSAAQTKAKNPTDAASITFETARSQAETQTNSVETAAVRVPLENYLRGHETGNPDFVRRAFHPEAKIISFRDGKLNQLTVEEFAQRFNGKPAPDEAARKRRIESLETTGNAAIAKIVLDYPSVKFTDYMSLVKIGGEWKIVNKTFYAEPRPGLQNK